MKKHSTRRHPWAQAVDDQIAREEAFKLKQREAQVYEKKMAVATLNDAINQIYNIEGDRWQMAYDTLEAIMDNLKIEVDYQPNS
jgi:hypothetical protein